MVIKHASAKSKGTRLERLVKDDLEAIGIKARRQPGSGIYSDFPHDNAFEVRGKEYLVECKARKDGHRTLDRWIGKADFLVIRADRKEPHVYMTWKMFKELIGP